MAMSPVDVNLDARRRTRVVEYELQFPCVWDVFPQSLATIFNSVQRSLPFGGSWVQTDSTYRHIPAFAFVKTILCDPPLNRASGSGCFFFALLGSAGLVNYYKNHEGR